MTDEDYFGNDVVISKRPEVDANEYFQLFFSKALGKYKDKFKLLFNEVEFFPEEWSSSNSTSFSIPNSTLSVESYNGYLNSVLSKDTIEVDKPKLGYDPNDTIDKKIIRYRFLLTLRNKNSVKYEIFKLKYEFNLYPICVYISDGSYELIGEKYDCKKPIKINNKDDFYQLLDNMVYSDSFKNIIRSLLAFA